LKVIRFLTFYTKKNDGNMFWRRIPNADIMNRSFIYKKNSMTFESNLNYQLQIGLWRKFPMLGEFIEKKSWI
jgi:hypothetical protein